MRARRYLDKILASLAALSAATPPGGREAFKTCCALGFNRQSRLLSQLPKELLRASPVSRIPQRAVRSAWPLAYPPFCPIFCQAPSSPASLVSKLLGPCWTRVFCPPITACLGPSWRPGTIERRHRLGCGCETRLRARMSSSHASGCCTASCCASYSIQPRTPSVERSRIVDPRASLPIETLHSRCLSCQFPYCTHSQIFHRLYHRKLGPHLTLPTTIVSQHAPSADLPASTIEPAIKTNRSVYLTLLILFSVKERSIWDLPKSMVSESLVRGIISIIHRC